MQDEDVCKISDLKVYLRNSGNVLEICVCSSGEKFKLEMYICDFMVNGYIYEVCDH